jgi:S1-C subfamily serine protease
VGKIFEVPASRWTTAVLLLFVVVHVFSWISRPKTPEQLAKSTVGSVVVIECKHGNNVSTTAGFSASNYCHIVTVAHGLDQCLGRREKNIVVRYREDPSIEYRAKIIRYSKSSDVGILQVPKHPNVLPLRIDDSLEQQVGSIAIAIGHPQLLYWSVTSGIVSADRLWTGVNVYRHVLQVSSLINQGNSGGPIINDKGKVIGIASFNINGNATLGFLVPNDILNMLFNGIYH